MSRSSYHTSVLLQIMLNAFLVITNNRQGNIEIHIEVDIFFGGQHLFMPITVLTLISIQHSDNNIVL